MTGKDLKNSILQLAIQGKLVPQNPNDEPACELLARIRQEKERLVKEKKLKKKDLETTPITDEEKPFEIPESWEWCRLGEISTYNSTKKKTNASEAERNTWCLDLEDVEKGGRLLERKTVEERVPIGDKTIFQEGDILYSKLRPYLLKILIAPEGGICTPEFIPFSCYAKVYPNYIVHVLKSSYVDNYINTMTFGTKMPRVSTDIMCALAIPLPPLAEQQRIVAKIEELMPLVEEYDKNEQKLAALNKALPEQLRQSVLQQAIMGRLVPQDDNDEPASELLIRIRQEKERLVKEKKLKKKDLEITPITDEKKPFEIPESWEWCRLKDICTKIVDGDHNPPAGIPNPTEFLMLSSQNINNDKLVNLEKVRYLTKEVFEKEDLRTKARQGDILFTSVGTLGRSCILNEDINICFQRSVTVICTNIYNRYLKRVLDSPSIQTYVFDNATGTAQKGFYINQMEDLVIPLPPLAEQQRIVAKIEELFSVIDNLKTC